MTDEEFKKLFTINKDIYAQDKDKNMETMPREKVKRLIEGNPKKMSKETKVFWILFWLSIIFYMLNYLFETGYIWELIS